MILIGNLFVVANGIWHETKIEHDVYFSLYNAVISFFSLLLCCSYADEIEEEMDEVIEAIAYINGEAFTDADFRSVRFCNFILRPFECTQLYLLFIRSTHCW